MRIWPVDLDSYDWWRREESGTIELPDVLEVNSEIDLAIPLRKALARLRHHTTPEPVPVIETEWRGYPYRFRFDADVSLWSTVMYSHKYEVNTPEGHVLEGTIDGVVGDGEILATTVVHDPIVGERFMYSWLWRVPLVGLLPKPKVIHLEVFHVEYRRESDRATIQAFTPGEVEENPDLNVLVVRGFHRLTYHPYPALMDDVRAHADEFAVIAEAAEWRGR